MWCARAAGPGRRLSQAHPLLRSIAVIAGVFVTFSAACSADPGVERSAEAASTTIVDRAGRTFSATTDPRSIISLVPSATQAIVALGEQDRLVGRTDFDTASAVSSLPSVGGGLEPSVEVLVSLNPDLVIRFFGQADQRTPAQLDQLGVPHFAVQPERIDDVLSMIDGLGRLLHQGARADSLTVEIEEALRFIRERVTGRTRPAVAFLLDGTPTWAAGSNTFVGELIQIAGGRNVFDDLERPWAPMSPEALVARDIDVVLTPAGSMPGGIPSDVLVLEVSNLTQLPGPRLAEAAEEIARALHPTAFP